MIWASIIGVLAKTSNKIFIRHHKLKTSMGVLFKTWHVIIDKLYDKFSTVKPFDQKNITNNQRHLLKRCRTNKKRRFVALFDIVRKDVERNPSIYILIVCNYCEIKWLLCWKFIIQLVYNYSSSFKWKFHKSFLQHQTLSNFIKLSTIVRSTF